MSDYGAAPGADINNLQLWDEEVQYNETQETLFQRILPDETKKHLVRWKLGPDGIDEKTRLAKDGTVMFMADLQGTVIAPGEDYDGAQLFERLSSYILKSGTSSMHLWLKAVGQAAPGRCSLRDLRERVAQAITGQPECLVKGQWTASIKDPQDPAGKKYITVIKGMKNFPMRPDGTYESTVTVNGQEVPGRFEVRDFYPS